MHPQSYPNTILLTVICLSETPQVKGGKNVAIFAITVAKMKRPLLILDEICQEIIVQNFLLGRFLIARSDSNFWPFLATLLRDGKQSQKAKSDFDSD